MLQRNIYKISVKSEHKIVHRCGFKIFTFEQVIHTPAQNSKDTKGYRVKRCLPLISFLGQFPSPGASPLQLVFCISFQIQSMHLPICTHIHILLKHFIKIIAYYSHFCTLLFSLNNISWRLFYINTYKTTSFFPPPFFFCRCIPLYGSTIIYSTRPSGCLFRLSFAITNSAAVNSLAYSSFCTYVINTQIWNCCLKRFVYFKFC